MGSPQASGQRPESAGSASPRGTAARRNETTRAGTGVVGATGDGPTGHGRASSFLLVRLRSIGDAVLMTPLAEAIRRAQPEAAVTLLVEAPIGELFREHTDVTQVIQTDRSPLGRLATLRRLRQQSFEVAVDLHGGSTAALLTWLSGARHRVGLDAYRRHWMYDELVPAPFKAAAPQVAEHTVTTNLAVARALGFPAPPSTRPRLYPSASGQAEAAAVLAQLGGPETGFVVVHPGAALASKKWPLERFVAVAEFLRADGQTVLMASPAGATTAFPRGLATLPAMGLAGLLALVARARLFIGNDSGPAHMAAAVDTPTITVFGSQNPRVWRPWGENHRALWAALPCSPCAGFHCGQPHHLACLDAVSIDQVVAAARALLAA